MPSCEFRIVPELIGHPVFRARVLLVARLLALAYCLSSTNASARHTLEDARIFVVPLTVGETLSKGDQRHDPWGRQVWGSSDEDDELGPGGTVFVVEASYRGRRVRFWGYSEDAFEKDSEITIDPDEPGQLVVLPPGPSAQSRPDYLSNSVRASLEDRGGRVRVVLRAKKAEIDRPQWSSLSFQGEAEVQVVPSRVEGSTPSWMLPVTDYLPDKIYSTALLFPDGYVHRRTRTWHLLLPSLVVFATAYGTSIGLGFSRAAPGRKWPAWYIAPVVGPIVLAFSHLFTALGAAIYNADVEIDLNVWTRPCGPEYAEEGHPDCDTSTPERRYPTPRGPFYLAFGGNLVLGVLEGAALYGVIRGLKTKKYLERDPASHAAAVRRLGLQIRPMLGPSVWGVSVAGLLGVKR